jgi:hypothetical protein
VEKAREGKVQEEKQQHHHHQQQHHHHHHHEDGGGDWEDRGAMLMAVLDLVCGVTKA